MTKRVAFLCCMIVFTLPLCTYAMMPVVDAGAIAHLVKNLDQLKSQYELLKNTYRNAQAQLTQMKQLKADAEGHYGFGRLLNGDQDLMLQEWSPDTWKRTLQGLSGGNAARYHELLSVYQKNHPSLSQPAFEKGASPDQSRLYVQDVQVNRAATVNATFAFNEIKSHLSRLHQLSLKIDQAQNSKAAIDLNSRLLTEMAYIQMQALKMQVLMNQQLAQTNADAIASKAAGAKFNTLPDK